MTDYHQTKILISALAADVISTQQSELIAALASKPDAVAIARTFGNPRLLRKLRQPPAKSVNTSLEVNFSGERVLYQGQVIGKTQILYKSPLPGELQARLATESAIDRFLEYLQKLHQIVVLDESDYHLRVFIPSKAESHDVGTLWERFLKDVAFSDYDKSKHQLPALVQTFILMLNTLTLSKDGFSTLDVPILTLEQSTVLAAWYLAIIRDVEQRQTVRHKQIKQLQQQLAESELSDKERKSKENDLQDKLAMQTKEAEKYKKYFKKGFVNLLEEQKAIGQEVKLVQTKLAGVNLTKAAMRKLKTQQDNLSGKIIFSKEFVQHKLELLNQSGCEPFAFIRLDREQNAKKFESLVFLSKRFNKTATDQINSSRGDIFTQCIVKMYRLMESQPRDSLPEPLLTEQPVLPEARSPGDDSKEFCYSCGVALDPKTARWQVLRFMFERPSQRCQSASDEDRPHICATCSALAFASPLKVTNDSIILRLEPADRDAADELKIKDYIRMLTNKELHLSGGRYLVLASDKTNKGDLASHKLGQVQYALAKIADIFPVEVLTDFDFSLITQSSQPISLKSRHLIFIKGLMSGYGQSIIVSGKDINLTLGDAVRYVEQDLPFLAEYTIAKTSGISNRLELEQIREAYRQKIKQDTAGDNMGSDQTSKRAKLYKDVAALTGLTYAFAQSLESTARKVMKPEDAEREVSKLIEQVEDAVAFCYYATLGDENKTNVQSRLYRNADNYFIYEQTKEFIQTLGVSGREDKDDAGKIWLTLYADDVMRAYTYFAEPNNKNGYAQEKDWKELTYNLKLSLYTRFPELVRKIKSTSEK